MTLTCPLQKFCPVKFGNLNYIFQIKAKQGQEGENRIKFVKFNTSGAKSRHSPSIFKK